MDFNTTIDIIIKDLNEAREIIDDLKRYPGVPLLQVELVKSKCKSASEVIALLKNMEIDHQVVEEVKTGDKKEIENPLETSGEKMVVTSQEEEKRIYFISGKSRQVISEKKEESRKSKEKLPETSIVADKFPQMLNLLNEQLGITKPDDDISDKLRISPITSLSDAIGVNDKFFFIREIFNGNKNLYNEAINKLEKTDNLPDARTVIISYTGEETENEAVMELLNLVKRKLLSNE